MFKIHHYLVLAGSVLCALLLLVGCSESPEESTHLIVGTHAGYPPYEMIDSKGNLTGFDIEVAEELAHKLGLDLAFKQMSFDALILALKQGKIDLILAGLSITPERLAQVDLIPYHGSQLTHLGLVTWNAQPVPLDQLQGKTVAVQAGTIEEDILNRFRGVQPKALDGIVDLVGEIKYGRSAAALMELPVAQNLRAQFPNIEVIEVPLPENLQFQGDGIALAKGREHLRLQVEQAVAELESEGILAGLHQKWFKGGESDVSS